MMPIPRFGKGFNRTVINKFDSPEEALQKFCVDCLQPLYPKIYVFPLLGRDGGIDGIQESTWVECKMCSGDDSKSLIRRWAKFENLLKNQLAKGENECQSQYKPWFSQNSPVKEYILFTNSYLPNESSVREVKEYISKVFGELSNTNSKLSHLKDVKIEIWHWGRIEAMLQQKTDLRLRWFPEFWPTGMIPIDIDPEGGFRSFLQSSKLPYYSLETHENISGAKSPIKTEKDILESFDNSEKIGKVIVGQAGVGKTRIALQTGISAQKKGWIVFRVSPHTPISSVGDLFENLKNTDKVLLVIDYIEVMDTFRGLVDEINNHNKKYDKDGRKVFYIATCRPSYYHRVIFGEYTHEPIIINTDYSDKWISGYMEEVVSHILKSSKILNFQEYIPICRGTPVLAVLMVYLYEKEEIITDIKEILEAKDFGAWFSNHLKLTLQFMDNSSVAKLMLCLPISEKIVDKMPSEMEDIESKLSSDGWIESFGEDDQIRYAIHDVISDRIVLSYCQSIRTKVNSFFRKALKFAREYDCLNSVIVSFERIMDNELLNDVHWDSLITDELISFPEEWKKHRLKLLSTSLLNPSQKIMLFEENEDYWTDLLSNPLFHQAFGWLMGWVSKYQRLNPGSKRIMRLKETIDPFIPRIINHVTNNFFICRALEFNPEKFCKYVFEWVEKNGIDTFILSAYIRSGYKDKKMEEKLNQWFESHSSDFEAYHILKALFNSGRFSSLESRWFGEWKSKVEISDYKIYNLIDLYLDGGGDVDNLISNLAFDDDLIQSIYVMLPRKGLKLSKNLIHNCLKFCKKNPNKNNSLWNLNKLLWNNYDKELNEEFVEALESILSQMKKEELLPDACSNLSYTLYKLIGNTYRDPDLHGRALQCFKICLKDLNSFDKHTNIYYFIQNGTFFYALRKLLEKKMLDINYDAGSVLSFINWYKRWESKNKTKIIQKIDLLKINYPSELWNLIG